MKYVLTACVLFSACAANQERVDLGLDMQQQEASNWCWAAAAQSVAAWRGDERTQSQVVSESFGRECTPQTCNATYAPHRFLRADGLRLVGYSYNMSTPKFWRLQLDRGVPLIVFLTNAQPVGADGGVVTQVSSHYMVIGGHDEAGRFFVLDPARGDTQTLPFEALLDYGAVHMHVVPGNTAYVLTD